jgi:glycosyltransferase involved in cell wall biosynthesis
MNKKRNEKLCIIYLANIKLPSERAHSIQTIEMCQAFSDIGCDVTLLIPHSKLNTVVDVGEHYSINQKFKIKRIGRLFKLIDLQIGSYLQTALFSLHATIYVLLHPRSIVYVKNEDFVYPLTFFPKKIFWEPHVGDMDFTARRLAKRAAGIVALTDGVRQSLINKGVPSKKIIVAHDAVRLDMFKNDYKKDFIRKELHLPTDKKIVIYTGHLFAWKGVHVLAAAAKQLATDTVIVFVGGLQKDVEEFKSKYFDSPNILVLGHKSRSEIPKYLAGADILALPNSGHTDISYSYTSPLKLFEYMAAKRPIVASDLPSLRETLSGQNAFLVPADNVDALAQAIKSIAVSADEVKQKVENAYALALSSTWYNRADKITQFITERV